ncbi:chemotaxis protein CheW [Lysobacter niastensis]|uniref:Chemotaxis protein CheW n=1 Tax=Lysobacter niastensis TaxID=380629 RepID=A0ABS0B9F0_9GAMM|nr:chemotaxis protein CheW [Lysobacter niastensis]MBF6025631.1 purine-binding chemotaxis protein CheW [Lysobacter niastensis]
MNSPVIDAYLEALLDAGPGQDAMADSLPVVVPTASTLSTTEIPTPEVAPVEVIAAPVVPAPVADEPARARPPIPPLVIERLEPRPLAAPPAAAPRAPSRSATPSPIASTHRWLRVNVGHDSYAIELLRVQEVGRTAPIVAMRGASSAVLGAMNLRGRIVPVFDLGLWLGTHGVEPDERARIVVVERDNELIGALVSAVEDVVTLGPDGIEPPLISSPSQAIVGVARVGAKPTVLLDANALFG